MEIQFPSDIFNEVLVLLEDKCISISNKILCQLGLPAWTHDKNNVNDRDLVRERQYNVVLSFFQYTETTFDQKIILKKDIQNVANKSGRIIFFDTPEGTGKTFLLNCILAEIRLKKKIILAVVLS